MGGLIALMVIGAWLLLCSHLAGQIVRRLGPGRYRTYAKLLILGALFVTPVIDEIIGKHQFAALCNNQNVYVSTDAANVKRAGVASSSNVDLVGYWIPIQSKTVIYFDKDTSKTFFSHKSLHTNGGWLLGGSYIFGMERYCDSEIIVQMEKSLHLKDLLEKGKTP